MCVAEVSLQCTALAVQRFLRLAGLETIQKSKGVTAVASGPAVDD